LTRGKWNALDQSYNAGVSSEHMHQDEGKINPVSMRRVSLWLSDSEREVVAKNT